jgi:hypothetical protein
MTHTCPGCGSNHCEVFYEVASVPATSRRLSPSRDEAVALPRGDIALEFCEACGLVFNGAFDRGLVDHAVVHEEIHASSLIFKAFQQRLADQLITRYALHDKDILEIGCGRGEFLTLLCELGANHGIGFEARYTPDPPSSAGIDATFRNELFTEITTTSPTDLVCSQRLLEYLADPTRFLSLLRCATSMRRDARLFLQVSNFMRTLRYLAFWEIHYPHYTYFSPGTLHRLLYAQGFEVGDIWTGFDGQYLMADARTAAKGTDGSSPCEIVETIADLRSLVDRFAQQCREKQAMWCEILRKLDGAGNRIAIWGAGSRAASFLTTLAIGDEVSCVIDASPSRQGKYMPGTGHPIVAPEVIEVIRADVVIVMNTVFTFEIRDLLARGGCAPTLLIA